MITHAASLPLNDGRYIPQLGLGTWQISNADAARIVTSAISTGYRHIDTAALYRNEAGVGQGLALNRIKRDDIFITTKLHNNDQGYESALRALDQSLARLKLSAVDLYLIHWPCPARGKALESWHALIEARRSGKARSIGVSNFRVHDLEHIIDATGVVPAVNQIELHPWLQQRELRSMHARHDIVTVCWSPLAQGGPLLANETLGRIAARYGKSPAQITLRWHIQSGLVPIPKSIRTRRMQENLSALNFALEDDDMAAINALDASHRVGPAPSMVN
jgi:2,5-diketo-D-gluconate reductase A